MMNQFKKILFTLLALAAFGGFGEAYAQHTLGVFGGAGMATVRLYPKKEQQQLFPVINGGLSWRYYSMPRYVGCVGVDLEYMQRGFSFGYTYTSKYDDQGKEHRTYKFFTRQVNTIMMPIVWQPHVYLIRNHLRVFLDAAVTFSYNFGGDYEYDDQPTWSGKYNWRLERDNRWNYGLAGGGGFALLFGQFEVGVRARYYFGYADLMRNLNKYYNNGTDGRENPFYYTPNRSPMDNLSLNVTLAYRFNKEGFETWNAPRQRDRQIKKKEFNFSEAAGGNSGRRRRR